MHIFLSKVDGTRWRVVAKRGVKAQTLVFAEPFETGVQNRLQKASQMHLMAGRFVPKGQEVLQHVVHFGGGHFEELDFSVHCPDVQLVSVLAALVVE